MYDSPNIVADSAESWRRNTTGAAKPVGETSAALSEAVVKRYSDE
jgi:hypothetical protein